MTVNCFIIKVCGLKQEANMQSIDALDLDYLGMIFFEKSKRFAGYFPVEFNSKHPRVGVFVNEQIKQLVAYCKSYNITTVQLHGSESPAYCAELKEYGLRIWKAFGIDENFDFTSMNQYENVCDLFLFDTKTPQHGGSGQRFNWDILDHYKGKVGFLLSGGIGPDALEDLIGYSHPQFKGVDLNSRFEDEPGIKNTKLLGDFVSALRKHFS